MLVRPVLNSRPPAQQSGALPIELTRRRLINHGEICRCLFNFIQKCINNIGLYRDDGLAIFKNTTGSQAFQRNLKSFNYLDITLNLTKGLFQPYRKPNDEPLYIDTKSNHPPTVIKQIPAAINRRISASSSNKETPSGLTPHAAKMSKPTSLKPSST